MRSTTFSELEQIQGGSLIFRTTALIIGGLTVAGCLIYFFPPSIKEASQSELDEEFQKGKIAGGQPRQQTVFTEGSQYTLGFAAGYGSIALHSERSA